MTLLAVPIFGSSIDQLRREIAEAVELGADLVELRLDLVDNVSDAEIRKLLGGERRDIPVILTIRSQGEGGHWDGAEDERISRLVNLGPCADYIDVELSSWQRSANIRQKVALALNRASHESVSNGGRNVARVSRRTLVLSRHDVKTRPPKLQSDLIAMLDASKEQGIAEPVPKLAWRARSVRDNFEAFELMRESPRPAIVICMGEDGLLSRVLARKHGAFATFASRAAGCETAPGQVSVSEMRDLYRWDAIDRDTRVYGVIGDPVRHSLSPRAHNAAFAETGENAVYLPLRVTGAYESFKAFMVEVLARPWLDFRGLSVTLPHKEHALRFLDETGAAVHPEARRIGSVNTLTIAPDGTLSGFNTDGAAALETVRAGLSSGRDGSAGPDPARGDLAGLRVAVLGAGGVARAVVGGLTEAAADVTIFNRTREKGEALARTFDCRCEPWEERARCDVDLIVNCTSLGQWPDVAASPMPPEALAPGTAVFDTVYHPPVTRLLQEASRRGCTAIDGLAMFALQAQAQFHLWTGRHLPAEVFRRAAEKGLSEVGTRPPADSSEIGDP